MKIFDKLKSLYGKFEDALFVEYSCICCGIETNGSNKFLLCEKCFAGLEKISGKVCKKCFSPLAGDYCFECGKMNYSFDKNISFYFYNDTTSKIIKNLKYHSNMTYAKYVAKMMTQNMNYFKDVDYLTFVPISSERLKLRGYNQAEELAREISKITQIEVVSLLSKDDGGKNQADLNMADRIENLKDCFHIKLADSERLKFKGKTIMIIDDVFTTGTTLSRCSHEIKKLRPKKIITMTLAKTKFDFS